MHLLIHWFFLLLVKLNLNKTQLESYGVVKVYVLSQTPAHFLQVGPARWDRLLLWIQLACLRRTKSRHLLVRCVVKCSSTQIHCANITRLTLVRQNVQSAIWWWAGSTNSEFIFENAIISYSDINLLLFINWHKLTSVGLPQDLLKALYSTVFSELWDTTRF